jgi:hypothetical protein
MLSTALPKLDSIFSRNLNMVASAVRNPRFEKKSSCNKKRDSHKKTPNQERQTKETPPQRNVAKKVTVAVVSIYFVQCQQKHNVATNHSVSLCPVVVVVALPSQ